MKMLEWPYPERGHKAFVALICELIDTSIHHPDNEFTESPDVTEFRSDLMAFKSHVIDAEDDPIHAPENLVEKFVLANLILNKLLTDPEKDADVIRIALYDSEFNLSDFKFIQHDIFLMIDTQFPDNELISQSIYQAETLRTLFDKDNTWLD